MTATLLPETADPARRATPARRPGRRSGRDLTLVAIVTLVSLVLFAIVGLPLLRILLVSLSPEGWDIVSSMLTDPVNRRILWNTIQLGIIVAVLGTLVGFVMAYAQVRLKFRGKKAMHLIALMPIVSPPLPLPWRSWRQSTTMKPIPFCRLRRRARVRSAAMVRPGVSSI